MPVGDEILDKFHKYDILVTDFYSETSKNFNAYEDLISQLWIGYLPLLKKKDKSTFKKNLNKLRKRRALKVTKQSLKIRKVREPKKVLTKDKDSTKEKESLKMNKFRKPQKFITSKRHALQKINHLRLHGFEVTMKTFLERERNFLNVGSPYTTYIQCTPARVYKMKFEFTN